MKRLAMIFCLLASSGAWAATPVTKDDLAKCAATANSVERLACFDDLAKQAGVVASTTDTSSPGGGKWNTATNTDPMTDKSVYTAILLSDNGKGRFGDPVALLLRCKDKKTEMFIAWSSYLGSDEARVTFRLDKEPAKTTAWSISTNGKATFYPSSPVSYLKKLVDGKSFVASVTPYHENSITAVFDITGADTALADIRKGCGW